MKKILILLLIALIFIATVKAAAEPENANNTPLTKEEKQKLKEQAKLKKAEEKKQKQILKEQQEEQLAQQKEAERLQREQEKKKAQEEAEALKQAQLEAEATAQCQSGTVKNAEGTCTQCSANCESCTSATHCNYCQVRFYRVVVEKKVNAYCSATIPTGYLPQIAKFAEMNPQITHTVPLGDAVAFDGKKAITGEPTPLPFKITQQGPVSQDGQKVRLDVVPCVSQCKQCPEGFLFESTTRSCTTSDKCVFPREIVTVSGQQQCKSDDPSVFKGQISVAVKEQKADSTLPQRQSASLKLISNQVDVIGITYSWSAVNAQGADLTPAVLAKGSFGQKIKADLTTLAAGDKVVFKCLVKDSKIENHQGYEVSTEYTV